MNTNAVIQGAYAQKYQEKCTILRGLLHDEKLALAIIVECIEKASTTRVDILTLLDRKINKCKS